MDVIAWFHLPIDGLCRVEHIETEVAASQHLKRARLRVASSHSLMGIVDGLSIIILCPGNVGEAGERETHQVSHLFLLGYVVGFIDVVECFVESTLIDKCHLCGIRSSIVEQEDVVTFIVRMLLIDAQGFLHQLQSLLRVALRQRLSQSLVGNIIGMPIF